MQTLKQRITGGEHVNVFAVSRMFHHNLIQIVGLHGGFHGFWIDHEHAGLSVEHMEIASMSGRSVGLECFVRIAPTDYALVTRCLESGASGVMAAQINSVEEAEEFVKWAKFMPRGRRGLNAGGFDGRFGNTTLDEFCERANRESFVAIQIETVESVECCEGIAAIDGVDLLFVGPADLSQALGLPGQFLHPTCTDAIARVGAACRRHGKHWGAVTFSAEHADMLVSHGCTMLSPTNDVRLVNAGVKATKQAFGKWFA